VLLLQNVASGVLAEIIRRQPASKGKTSFAWSVAVGPALARVTSVELTPDRVLRVRVRDARWAREVERARDIVLTRLRMLLGDDNVIRIDVCVNP
jgi:Dna[CI] antecedent DciA-like protein